MNATVQRAHLVRLLQLVQAAASTDGAAIIPAMACVRLEADGAGGALRAAARRR